MSNDHLVTSIEQLEAIYGETHPPALAKETDRITRHYRTLIEASPFFALASAGRTGSIARRAAIRRDSCVSPTRRRC